MSDNLYLALTQYATDYMRNARHLAHRARELAEDAAEKAKTAEIYADQVAVKCEFFQPVIKMGLYRCPRCWANGQDNQLQSVDEVAGTSHCDACAEDFKSEPNLP